MKDRTRWLLGGLGLGAGAIGAGHAYWKRKNVLHTEKKVDVWARPGMEVTFRAELMPSRDRNQRTFLVKELLASGRGRLHRGDRRRAGRGRGAVPANRRTC